jgi:hypothetical protein
MSFDFDSCVSSLATTVNSRFLTRLEKRRVRNDICFRRIGQVWNDIALSHYYLCRLGTTSLLHYSTRRAWVGEMEAARLAGMMAAKKEQMARATAEMESASGSQEETP